MTRMQLPLPPHFDPDAVDRVRRVDYAGLAKLAADWQERHRLAPASEDRERVCLLAVDVQITFCLPDSELFVAGRSGTGAVEDTRRLCEFIYRNLASITRVFPTLDTHYAFQIFHPGFLERADGSPPEPQRTISVDDVEQGRIRARSSVCRGLRLDPDEVNRHLLHYARQLEKSGKYAWMVWPYHAMLGGIGHALVPAFEEAVFFHSLVRSSPAGFQIKGNKTLTEHYSVFGPEVEHDPDGRRLAEQNDALFHELSRYDRVLVAGQAQSHCVAWTLQDIIENPTARQLGLGEKVWILEDCMSPVVIPDVIDFTNSTEDVFKRFVQAGMKRIRSTDPFPGVVETRSRTV